MTNTAALYARLKTNGICTICHKSKTPEDFATCDACREARKAYRTTLKRAGICTHCKDKALPDLTVCQQHKNEQNERQKEVYAARKKAQECRRCGTKSSKRLCAECFKANKRYSKNLEKRRQKQGLCTACGRELALLPFLLGEKCRKKNIEVNARWRQKPGKATHERARVKKRRELLVEKGLCGSCGSEPLATRTRRDGKIVTLKRCERCSETNRLGHLLKKNRERETRIAEASGV